MRLSTKVRFSASLAVIALLTSPAAAAAADLDSASAQQTAPRDPAVEPAPAPAEGEIIVTGIRQSLQSARNIRRNAEQIVDAIVAEDIGKLPDVNTAQTAARIPGLQVYRQGGEAQNVLVRGLPNFTTSYNGREIFTAETRVVALQDFPSANIAALEVFKTSAANLVEPGLAGLVNIRSRRPFDFSTGQIAGSVWGVYTVQAKSVTPNFNGLVTERWDTGAGEMGLLLNVSYTELDYLDSEPSNTDFIADPVINGQRVRYPDIQRLFYRSGNRVRPSVNAAFQWRPNDTVELYADFLWQGFRNKIDDRLVAVPLYGGGSYTNLVFRPNTNQLSSGTINGLADPIFTFQGGTYNRTDTFQYAAGGIYESGPLRLVADIARTDTAFRGSTESVDRIFAGQAGTSVDFDLEVPQFTIRNFDPSNPANYLFDGLYEQKQKASGSDWQLRLDGTYTIDEDGPLRSVEAGVRYTDRTAGRVFGDRFAGFRGRNITATALPLDFRMTPPGFVGTDVQSGFRSFLSPTYSSIRGNLEALRQFVITSGGANYTVADLVPAVQFDAAEETLAGYAQLNFGMGDLEAVLGARALHVKTRVSGAQPTGIDAIDRGSKSTRLLPNASLRWRPDEQWQFRLAASKTITRPNFSDLVPFITLGAPPPSGVGTDSDPYQAFGGNPFLRPFESWNYDASLEYYFGPASFAALTVFHRSIDGFIQQNTFRVTDTRLGVIQITGPVNTGKGRITGTELQFQAFADFPALPDWARGFGIQANVTYLDAETQQPDGQGGLAYFPITDQLNGVSDWNYNLVGIYERYGFSARLSYNGRSSYAATRQYRGDDLYTETAFPAGRLDLSLNYDIFPNATIFADWTNITQSPFRQEFRSARAGAPRADYVRYLRYDESTVSLGLRFRL
ncbi:MAG: TonB-dependent receptor [Allosphingosinicella sp.]|uniref:TonB-dependent receptor n=1 Tax=Allosphingosinicella sp. TaxID=2823234 RepID=UPI003938F29E